MTGSLGSSKNPSTSEQGLMITKNKYMDVTDNWTASTSGISLYIWLYYKQGGIGIFAQIGLKVISQLIFIEYTKDRIKLELIII